MKRFKRSVWLCLIFVLLAAPSTQASGFMVAAVEDRVQTEDPELAATRMTMIREAGFNTVIMTHRWIPGQFVPHPPDLAGLRIAVLAANQAGLKVCINFSNHPRRDFRPPLTSSDQTMAVTQLSGVAKTVPSVNCWLIGNEPNSHGFWRPQYRFDGQSAAPRAYTFFLAKAYDELKKLAAQNLVCGGGTTATGSDNSELPEGDHSPPLFIREMGKVYRESGRRKPLMDAWCHHPYGRNSAEPPDFVHQDEKYIGLADYGRLMEVLGQAFNGTPQRGSNLPVFYTEYGVQSRIPLAKRHLYSGIEAPGIQAVSEPIQGDFYSTAIEMGFCQRTVIGLSLFLFFDEERLEGWQSALYYADETPKTSLEVVRPVMEAAKAGAITCS